MIFAEKTTFISKKTQIIKSQILQFWLTKFCESCPTFFLLGLLSKNYNLAVIIDFLLGSIASRGFVAVSIFLLRLPTDFEFTICVF